jgi:hypothetical protein
MVERYCRFSGSARMPPRPVHLERAFKDKLTRNEKHK